MLKSMLVKASCPLRRLLIKRSEESREIEGKGVLVIEIHLATLSPAVGWKVETILMNCRSH